MKDIEEALSFLQKSGIVDEDNINLIYMNSIKKKHPFSIWQGSKGYWYTYLVYDGIRKQIKRKNKRDLLEQIKNYYAELEETKYSFREVFKAWLSEKLSYREITPQTYDRYLYVYNAYVDTTDFADEDIRLLHEPEIVNFVKSSIVRCDMSAKQFSSFRLIIAGAFRYAKFNGYSDVNITMVLSDMSISEKAFRRVVKNPKEQVFSRDEAQKVLKYIENNPDLKNWGIALTFFTGLRVGELSTLKYSDFKGSYITVRRTEIKYRHADGKTHREVKDTTKTENGMRDVFLSKEAQEVVTKLLSNKEIKNPDDFVFINNRGTRSLGGSFDDRIARICKKLSIPRKSMHDIRRTYASYLINAQVNESVIVKQLGHYDIKVTKDYYYYDVLDREECEAQLNAFTMFSA